MFVRWSVVALVLALSVSACTTVAEPSSQPATTATSNVSPAPQATPRFGVGYVTTELVDQTRFGRRIPVSIWVPQAPGTTGPAVEHALAPHRSWAAPGVVGASVVADGRHPVIVFSHGSGASRLLYGYLTEALAASGFVVIAPDHLGNTFADSSDVAGLEATAVERPRDLRLLVDLAVAPDGWPEPVRSLLAGHLDIGAIGVAGHSYGGYAALAEAGGQDGIGRDVRVSAVAALEPLSDRLSDETLRRVGVPTLLMGGTLDTTTPIDPMATRPFSLVTGRPLLEVDVIGADHESFTGACDIAGLGRCPPEVLPAATAHELIVRYVVAFFAVHLRHDPTAAADLQPDSGVSMRGV